MSRGSLFWAGSHFHSANREPFRADRILDRIGTYAFTGWSETYRRPKIAWDTSFDLLHAVRRSWMGSTTTLVPVFALFDRQWRLQQRGGCRACERCQRDGCLI